MGQQDTCELSAIRLKGEIYGLRMVVHEEADLHALRLDLQRLAEEGEHILSGAKVVIDLQERDLTLPEVLLFLEHFPEEERRGSPGSSPGSAITAPPWECSRTLVLSREFPKPGAPRRKNGTVNPSSMIALSVRDNV